MTLSQQINGIVCIVSEVLANATAQGSLVKARAMASVDRESQAATRQGWDAMCSRLDLTSEDHRLSVLLIKELREKEELYKAVGYPQMVAHATQG